MKKSKKNITIFIFLILLITAIIGGYFFAPYILSRIIENRILTSFKALKQKGIEIHYDTLYSVPDKVGVKNMTIAIPILNKTCTVDKSTANIGNIKITGIHILPLIFNNVLEIDSLLIDQVEIDYVKIFRKPAEKKKIKGVNIGYLSLNSTIIKFIDSASCRPLKIFQLEQLELHKLSLIDLNLDSMRCSASEAIASKVKIQFPDQLYTIRIKQANYSATKKVFNIDSLHVEPDKEKAAFAAQVGYQTDRINLIAPSIQSKGFEIISLTKPLIYAESISINMWLDVFRDKRYPFMNKSKPLPMKYLRSLPYFLQIDTVKLFDSYVAYEEFPEGGDKAGNVFFNKLNAVILNLSNNSSNDTQIESSSSFMNSGILKIHLIFPSDKSKPYSAKGDLTNFSFAKINSMLTPLANAEISEGTLKDLKFNFVYNETRADGEVEMDYRDLKLTTFKKNIKEKSSNRFLSLLLNLVVRDDMNANTNSGKNKGTILFYRDPQKSIFNYWWKSVLSGIKSVYNLDKIMDTDGKK